jgi:hypothetical protein
MRLKTTVILWTGLLLAGCATIDRALMPTPSVYQVPGGPPAFDLAAATDQNPNLELLAAGINIAFPQRDLHLDTMSPLRVHIEGAEQPN